jgi:replicative DNA helicase
LGRISRQLKLLANDLGITVIVLSQLNRNVEQREDKRPLMSDLRQSGNLEEDADIMVALYRDDVYVVNSPYANTLEFIIRKSRNGPIGTVSLNFNKETVNVYDTYADVDWSGG